MHSGPYTCIVCADHKHILICEYTHRLHTLWCRPATVPLYTTLLYSSTLLCREIDVLPLPTLHRPSSSHPIALIPLCFLWSFLFICFCHQEEPHGGKVKGCLHGHLLICNLFDQKALSFLGPTLKPGPWGSCCCERFRATLSRAVQAIDSKQRWLHLTFVHKGSSKKRQSANSLTLCPP